MRPWWRDPVLRAMAISLGAGLALLAFVSWLYFTRWPNG